MAFSAALVLLSAQPSVAGAQDISVPKQFAPVAPFLEAKDWTGAMAEARVLGPIAQDLVIWTRLRAGEGSFDEGLAFLERNPQWPAENRVRLESERKIAPFHAPQTIVDFFAEIPPQTGEGALAYAKALIQVGRPAEIKRVLLGAWLTLPLDAASEAALLDEFGKILRPYVWARMDAMLWRWRIEDASRLVFLLPDERRQLFEARVAQIRGYDDRAARLEEVPTGLRPERGLAYDRFNRLAESGEYSQAIEIALTYSTSARALGQPFRWASWRGQLARWLMREGRAEEAYALASHHFLTSGEQFADLEWLSGYIALRFLGRPDVAGAHFERQKTVSNTPISLSRAAYWQGRAAEAQNQPAEAFYAEAAQHQTAFYGLLAAEHLGQSLDPALAAPAPQVLPPKGAALFEAMELLLGAGRRSDAVLFLTRLAETASPSDLAGIGGLLAARDETFLTLLLGKAAAARGIVMPAYYYPVHALADLPLPIEPALALSIARRESEFNPVVGSSVGALGLMQLMPATAEEVSKSLGLPYARTALTQDWAYNATLGSEYLHQLEERFGKSPVLQAVGYNAGPGRVRQWTTARGDPRDLWVDVIDWIEDIPFTETRNYVMRVTESIPVYRARLTGEAAEIGFLELLHGRRPMVRPQARPATEG